MACESWSAKLDAYVDGELASSESKDVATHLRECTSCASYALGLVQMKRSIAAAGKRYQPGAEFREKIQKTIGSKPQRGGSWYWKIVAVPAALVLILSVAVNLYVDREKARRESVYSELTDLHVATLASANPVDVISTDRHTVKPWFQGKIPFTFNLPELQGTDFALVGGRVTYLGQVPGAHLIYQIRKHQISVFIFPEDLVSLQIGSKTAKERSFNLQTFTQDSLRYIVFGDVAADDIKKLSE